MIRRDMLAVLQDLPEMCFSRVPGTGEPVILARGHKGYWPTHPSYDVEELNAYKNITAAQVTAMTCGSIFGFDVPAADPTHYPDIANASDYNAPLRLRWLETMKRRAREGSLMDSLI